MPLRQVILSPRPSLTIVPFIKPEMMLYVSPTQRPGFKRQKLKKLTEAQEAVKLCPPQHFLSMPPQLKNAMVQKVGHTILKRLGNLEGEQLPCATTPQKVQNGRSKYAKNWKKKINHTKFNTL